jgi:thioredoxin-like negative regulator of GroEL
MNQTTEQHHDYERLMRQARQFRRSKSYAEAAEAFVSAAHIAQDNRDALLPHAACLQEAGDKDAAHDA